MEPGETIEQAAAREVYEEARVRIEDVRYCFCQPWPFPSSLMIGCLARATSWEIELLDKELEAADWFARDEIVAALERSWDEEDGILLPPPLAIAHQLMRVWVETL